MIHDDKSASDKIGSGRELTHMDIQMLLDDNTADNIIKRAYNDLLIDTQIQQYIEDKTELQVALQAIINGLARDAEWQEQLENERYQHAKMQRQAAEEEQEKEEALYISEMQGKDVFAAIVNDLPELPESVREALNKRFAEHNDPNVDRRELTATLDLCGKNPCLHEFILPLNTIEHDVDEIFNKIMFLATAIKTAAFKELFKDITSLKEEFERSHRHGMHR